MSATISTAVPVNALLVLFRSCVCLGEYFCAMLLRKNSLHFISDYGGKAMSFHSVLRCNSAAVDLALANCFCSGVADLDSGCENMISFGGSAAVGRISFASVESAKAAR